MSNDSLEMIGFVPTNDLDRATPFFGDVLGFEFVARDEFASIFTSNDQMFRLVAVGDFSPHLFTILGWRTPDIRTTTERLVEKGLSFIQYRHFNQDDVGIWTAPGGAKVAWFNDTDGNVLSYTEYT